MLLSLHRVLAATWIALVGCQEPPALYPPTAPPEIREACALTERRCTECHDHDRIVGARKSRDEWAATVQRMREMPGSTIRPDEADTILRCLLYRNDAADLEPHDDLTMHRWIALTQ